MDDLGSGGATATERRPPSRGRKILVGAIIVLLALILLGMCTGGGDDSSSKSGGEATTSSSSSDGGKGQKKADTSTTPANQLQDSIDLQFGHLSRAELRQGAAVVTFEIADNVTKSFILGGAKRDVAAIVSGAQDVPAVKRLSVVGTFPMEDKYGQDLGQTPVLRATFTPQDLNQIQADDVTVQDRILDIASGGSWVHPALTD